MKSLTDLFKCCGKSNKDSSYGNVDTVVVDSNKFADKSTKSAGSGKENSTDDRNKYAEVEKFQPSRPNNQSINFGNENFTPVENRCNSRAEMSMSLLNVLGEINNSKVSVQSKAKSVTRDISDIHSETNHKSNKGPSLKEKNFDLEMNEINNELEHESNVTSLFDSKQQQKQRNLSGRKDYITSKYSSGKNQTYDESWSHFSPIDPNHKHSDISFKNEKISGSGAHLYTYSNDSYISACSVNFNTNNIVILDAEIAAAKKLLLEDVSGILLNGERLQIDASGLKNGLRNKRDGFAFFGINKSIKNEVVCDYLINYVSSHPINRPIFVVFYDRLSQKFYFRNMKESLVKDKTLLYVKISDTYKIETKKFFLMGHILVNIEPDYKERSVQINVYFAKSKLPKSYVFSAKDSPISLGRYNDNTIVVDHSLLSKHQCRIYFDNKSKLWTIADGSGKRKSTHGTWLMVDSKFEISDNTDVKFGNSIIRINYR